MQNGGGIDQRTVADQMESQGHVREGCDFDYLTQLITATPTAFNAPPYAAEVKELARRRDMLRIASDIAKSAFDNTINLSDAIEEHKERLTTASRSAIAPSSAERFKVHWADEALELQLPIAYAVKPIFCAGSVSVLVGEGGSEKTYVLLDAAVCIARGKPWLEFENSRDIALIIDEESGQRRLKHRIANTLRGYGGDANTKVGYVSLAQLNLYEPTDVNTLHLLVKQNNAGCVVIDALVDVMLRGDENSTKDVQPIFVALRGIAEDTRAAIVLIHHATKAGSYRGSTAINAACDLMLIVENGQDNRMTLNTEKARDIKPIIFGATSHFEDGAFYLAPSEPKNPQADKQEEIQAAIRDVFKVSQPLGKNELAANVAYRREAVFDAVNAVIRANQVSTVTGKRGKILCRLTRQ